MIRHRGTAFGARALSRHRRVCAGCLLLVATACSDPADPRAELLRLQEVEQRAHLEYDAALLTSLFADTLVLVEEGEAEIETPAEAERRFSAYFDAVTFLEWSDLQPPGIEVASSADLATVRVRRRVRLASVDSAGRSAPEHTVFTWRETWRKEDGAWRLAAVVSTERAGREDVAAVDRRAVPGPGDRTAEEILARARAAAGTAGDSLRSLAYTAVGFSPTGPFRTSVRSEGSGRMELRQTTSSGDRVRRSVGAFRGEEPDSVGRLRAFLQGHALLHLAADPAAILGPPRRSGMLRFAGRRADVVEFEDGAGHPLELMYASSSGELIGARLRNPARPEEVLLLYFSGWEEEDGRVLPRRAVFQQGGDLFVYRIVEVQATGPPRS